jgi:acyl-CoA synthetase (NDP forming)
MRKQILRDFASVQALAGFKPSQVEFAYGELALDLIGHATAEELISAFRVLLSDEATKAVVGHLLEAGITFDDTIDGSVS